MKKLITCMTLVAALCFVLPGCGSDSPEDICDDCPAAFVNACIAAVTICQEADGDNCGEIADDVCDDGEIDVD